MTSNQRLTLCSCLKGLIVVITISSKRFPILQQGICVDRNRLYVRLFHLFYFDRKLVQYVGEKQGLILLSVRCRCSNGLHNKM
ncbi:unnamed protein product [Photorhabdus laumondii subsp. laumondii TTO1]|uniref:Photorhabdus luminescens subsp. laumondii TTO1 complete genome segment 4/17 n=1 Tax=Photorhabdus laumondii subsp. laumondii (strain DSM 15139 / CIP 105565 / TT01) TaxID=243265 RepID=Q7N7R3_PHOLL|nr:unnamed protein product [Photorhabdus laumondii subsp. laumondii TTO1]